MLLLTVVKYHMLFQMNAECVCLDPSRTEVINKGLAFKHQCLTLRGKKKVIWQFEAHETSRNSFQLSKCCKYLKQ